MASFTLFSFHHSTGIFKNTPREQQRVNWLRRLRPLSVATDGPSSGPRAERAAQAPCVSVTSLSRPFTRSGSC